MPYNVRCVSCKHSWVVGDDDAQDTIQRCPSCHKVVRVAPPKRPPKKLISAPPEPQKQPVSDSEKVVVRPAKKTRSPFYFAKVAFAICTGVLLAPIAAYFVFWICFWIYDYCVILMFRLTT